MDEHGDQHFARYGVDIKPVRWHFEADTLAQIAPALNGHTGSVTVMDRASGSVAFEGAAEEVRAAIAHLAAPPGARVVNTAPSIRPKETRARWAPPNHGDRLRGI